MAEIVFCNQPDIVTVTKEADQHLSKIITEGNAKGVMLAV